MSPNDPHPALSSLDPPESPARKGPMFVAPSTRVNVALPFSKITVETPSADQLELATIVAELAEELQRTSPSPEGRQLADRAAALCTKWDARPEGS